KRHGRWRDPVPMSKRGCIAAIALQFGLSGWAALSNLACTGRVGPVGGNRISGSTSTAGTTTAGTTAPARATTGPTGGSGGASGTTSTGPGGTGGNPMPPPRVVGACDGLKGVDQFEQITPPGIDLGKQGSLGVLNVVTDPVHSGTIWVGTDHYGFLK